MDPFAADRRLRPRRYSFSDFQEFQTQNLIHSGHRSFLPHRNLSLIPTHRHHHEPTLVRSLTLNQVNVGWPLHREQLALVDRNAFIFSDNLGLNRMRAAAFRHQIQLMVNQNPNWPIQLQHFPGFPHDATIRPRLTDFVIGSVWFVPLVFIAKSFVDRLALFTDQRPKFACVFFLVGLAVGLPWLESLQTGLNQKVMVQMRFAQRRIHTVTFSPYHIHCIKSLCLSMEVSDVFGLTWSDGHPIRIVTFFSMLLLHHSCFGYFGMQLSIPGLIDLNFVNIANM